MTGDTIHVGWVPLLVFVAVALGVWLLFAQRRKSLVRQREEANKPYDPVEDAQQHWSRAARIDWPARKPPAVGPITGRPLQPSPTTAGEAQAPMPEQQTPQPAVPQPPPFYVERILPGNGAVFGWIMLVLNNVICVFAMGGVQTVWAQILSGVIQLNGNVVILLLMFLGRRSIFVPQQGRPPDGAQ